MDINEDNKRIWNRNADYWDAAMGNDGNHYHQELIAPITLDFLELKANAKILDIGCGNGVFARKLVQKGVQVTAFDFAEENIRNAKKYDAQGIDYRVLDATVNEDLRSLGEDQFDGAVANMVLMDIPEIDTLFKGLTLLLKPNGIFVFSVSHPFFNGGDAKIIDKKKVEISEYSGHRQTMGEAITNQPELQYYFDRTLTTLFNTGFKNGFVADGLEEPVFSNREGHIFSKIPPVIIVRMRMIK